MNKKEIQFFNEMEKIFLGIIDKQIAWQEKLHNPKTKKETLIGLKQECQISLWREEIWNKTFQRLVLSPQFNLEKEQNNANIQKLNQIFIILDEELKKL